MRDIMINKIDGVALKQMISLGARNLQMSATTINDLNVFPVPDGDTGTNMCFTMDGAVKGVMRANGPIGEVAASMAKGALLGARGNSGVILSQFLKGLAVGFEGLEEASAAQVATAFQRGVEYAYKSVLKPTEGTILTVLRESTDYACKQDSQDVQAFIEDFIKESHESLKRTPDLLPVLKKAGVVDSGAAGLICVIEGFLKFFTGEELDDGIDFTLVAATEDAPVGGGFNADSVLEYGYCTEFILQLQNAKTDIKSFDVSVITDYLETVGDSIVAIKDDDVVKIHVHTKTPAKVIDFCQRFGEFVTFKMENMSVQHSEVESAQPKKQPAKELAVVAVATGEGIKQAFINLGVSAIVEGGQTMNPSSEDFLKAFNEVNASTIIVLPNNSNVYLSAKQASEMYAKSHVIVVNTTSVAEGYSALTMFDPSIGSGDEIAREFEATAKNVTTLSVTYAVKDGSMDGVDYAKGDYICVSGKTMLSSGKDCATALIRALEKLDMDDYEVATLFYGEDASEADKATITEHFGKTYRAVELFELDGGQNVYPFILSLE